MGLVESLKQAKVTELPLFSPLKLRASSTVRSAIEQMRKRKLGSVVVVDENDQALGLFSERRLVNLIAGGKPFLDDPIEHHMVTESIRISQDAAISEVLQTMQDEGLRFLVVVDDQNRTVGQTGQKSVLRYLAEHLPRSVKVQAMDSKLYMDQREGA